MWRTILAEQRLFRRQEMANFIAVVYGTLKANGIDTSKMSTDEAIKKFNELQGGGGKKESPEDVKKKLNGDKTPKNASSVQVLLEKDFISRQEVDLIEDEIKALNKLKEMFPIEQSESNFDNVFNGLKKYQKGTADKNNFFVGTMAKFNEVDKPNREPDFVSDSGSVYWYTKDGVVRGSDHWGIGVASCDWAFVDKNGKFYNKSLVGGRNEFDGVKYGFCKWKDFSRKLSFDYVYNKDDKQWIIPTFANTIGKDEYLINNKKYYRY